MYRRAARTVKRFRIRAGLNRFYSEDFEDFSSNLPHNSELEDFGMDQESDAFELDFSQIIDEELGKTNVYMWKF